jgi:hypothetical protein
MNYTKNKIDLRFINSNIEDSIAITQEIIIDAKTRVSVLSDSFNEFFYSKLEESIIYFLNKSEENRFELVVLDTINDNELIQKFRNDFSIQFQVKCISEYAFPIDNDTQNRVNYIVNDNNAFRYEYGTKSISNFNNEQDAKVLVETFNHIWQDS